jgi:restriction system protein
MSRSRRRKNSDASGLGVFGLLGAAFIYSGFSEFRAQPNILVSIALILATVTNSIFGLMIYRAVCYRRILRSYTISNIDAMEGWQFERYLAELLRKRGHKDVRLTERYDYGVDIIAKKNGVTWGIQAKRYNKPVRAAAVRQVYTALIRYKCDRAMVISNSMYSRPAWELAKDTKTVLIGRDRLAMWVYELSKV